MWTFIMAVHYVACFVLIMFVLLQSGKGTDMGAAFGGSSQTVFGPSGGATFLSKLTVIVAITILTTSISLAYHSTQRRDSSLIKSDKKVEETTKSQDQKVGDEGKGAVNQGEAVKPAAPETSKSKGK